MSYQASSWALRDAPVGGNSTARLILMALAEYASPTGKGAYPSVPTLMALVRKSERSVRDHLAELERQGIIRRGDQRKAAAIRADLRPVVWDLCMPQAGESGMPVRQEKKIVEGLTEDGVQPAAPREEGNDLQPTAPRDTSGVQPTAPRFGERGAVQRMNGVQPAAPNRKDKPLLKTPYSPPQGATAENVPRKRTTLDSSWQPNAAARTFALEHGLNIDSSVTRFRLWAGQGQRLRDWDTRFLLWLSNEKPSTTATVRKPHRHTWKCAHVLHLLGRTEDTALTDDAAFNAARLLNEGKTETEALHEMGLPADELEDIA